MNNIPIINNCDKVLMYLEIYNPKNANKQSFIQITIPNNGRSPNNAVSR